MAPPDAALRATNLRSPGAAPGGMARGAGPRRGAACAGHRSGHGGGRRALRGVRAPPALHGDVEFHVRAARDAHGGALRRVVIPPRRTLEVPCRRRRPVRHPAALPIVAVAASPGDSSRIIVRATVGRAAGRRGGRRAGRASAADPRRRDRAGRPRTDGTAPSRWRKSGRP